MKPLIWIAIAWLGGTAAILGTLMLLGSLLLLLVPNSNKAQPAPHWPNQLKLIAVALSLATAGLGLLALIPFPHRL